MALLLLVPTWHGYILEKIPYRNIKCRWVEWVQWLRTRQIQTNICNRWISQMSQSASINTHLYSFQRAKSLFIYTKIHPNTPFISFSFYFITSSENGNFCLLVCDTTTNSTSPININPHKIRAVRLDSHRIAIGHTTLFLYTFPRVQRKILNNKERAAWRMA